MLAGRRILPFKLHGSKLRLGIKAGGQRRVTTYGQSVGTRTLWICGPVCRLIAQRVAAVGQIALALRVEEGGAVGTSQALGRTLRDHTRR